MEFALLARFGSPVVELKEVCDEFFGISPKTAQARVNEHRFPVPTFKAEDSQRCPTLVRVSDLAQHLEKRYEASKTDWMQVWG